MDGVPDSTHPLDKASPVGSDGAMLHETMAPPELETPTGVIACPVYRLRPLTPKVIDGATSLTVKVIVVEEEPAELFAYTV